MVGWFLAFFIELRMEQGDRSGGDFVRSGRTGRCRSRFCLVTVIDRWGQTYMASYVRSRIAVVTDFFLVVW